MGCHGPNDLDETIGSSWKRVGDLSELKSL
jgi:hypothetical protein